MPRRLIVVSNRGPITYDRVDGRRVERRGGGGLVTALRGLLDEHAVTWIASAMTDEDRAVAAEGDGEVVLVAHDPEAYDLYYNTVANPFLWFVQHDLWDRVHAPELDAGFRRAWEEGYRRVNESFAEEVVVQIDNDPGATVLFHDYHLYLAPALVRAARPDARLAHFVHIPWPADWSLVPEPMRSELHDGLLGNDVVAFHTARWAHNFERSCTDVLGGTREALVAHHPISIDVAEFGELSTSDAVLRAERELLAERSERLIVRVDRTELSKNIVRGVHAYALLLEEHPEWLGRVVLLVLLNPSRQDVPEYAEYLAAIEASVAEVNARYAGQARRPVDLRVSDDFPRSVAAYKQYDVLLVNAIADGMNLVAKEGPLVNERDGVLVLSENAGAHEELGDWALTVNPFDVQGQADALHAALSLEPAERRRRAEALRAYVREHDVTQWLEGLLADVDRKSA